MRYAAGVMAVIAFIIAFERLRIAEVAQRAVTTSGRATAALRDAALDDDEKERLVRRASISLARDVLSITVRGAGALLATLLPVLLLNMLGLVELEAVLAWLASWQAILLISIAVTVWMLARRRA